ncbi:site-specific integrase [Gordonia jinhuaensis]|nr:site-specific integrase [Gordonia jinhuaensis]
MFADLALWLVSTGMRFGEATALRPGDIDVENATARVGRAWKYSGGYSRRLGPPKTRKSRRTIDLTPQAVEVAGRHADGEWLFSLSSGGPVSPQGFWRRAWEPARRAAREHGLTKTPRVHDLRHTNASWMIASGIPLPMIQAHLGHESITTTIDRYGHLDRTSGKAAARAIGDLLSA